MMAMAPPLSSMTNILSPPFTDNKEFRRGPSSTLWHETKEEEAHARTWSIAVL
uniref:UPS2 n=1 Tax=Arundo donax TaxID=35708 RepID=A0A0A8XSV0_ARUDO